MVKTKKKNLAEISQQKHIQQNKKSFNPFEVHINKDKLKVLGRKAKTDKGLPGISRAKAISKRKRTLFVEYKQKNKDNVFLDKRIGEKNFALSEEDKAMARFAAERVKAHRKKDIFNLNDEEVLTHRGQTLQEIEKFDDPRSDDEYSDDEDRTGKLDKQFVSEAHFGGGILSKADSSTSRKNLIEQLIAESKKRKAEKQKIREQTMDLTEKLDTEWKDLLPMMSISKASDADTTEKTKADDFDIALRELRFEARGHPSDKLKSEEEIIMEEKERLEALEADRLARMKGFLDNPSNEVRHKSADDLEDGFVMENIAEETLKNEENNLTGETTLESANDNEDDESDHINNDADEEKNLIGNENDEKSDGESNINGGNVETEEDSDHESEGSVEDDLSDLKVSESSSEDEIVPVNKNVKFANDLTKNVADRDKTNNNELKSILKKQPSAENIQKPISKTREQEIRDDLSKRKHIMEQARKELPYTYKAPESFEELQKLLHDRNPEYQTVIVDRIIKCNHWTLDKENKEKLSNLFGYLLEHISNCALKTDAESVTKCFQIFDRLCPHLYDLAHADPLQTKSHMQELIKKKHEEFEKNKKKYPNLDTLIFFKLVSLLYPTSDFRHPVVTPCLVFMSQILFRCRVRSFADMSKGLFVCTLLLEYTVLSKRFTPSAINFLRGIIYAATPKHLLQGIKIIPPFKAYAESSSLLVLEEDQRQLDINLSDITMEASDLVLENHNDDTKIRILLTATKLISEFKKQLENLDAVYSIFEPILKLLKLNKFEKYPRNIRKHTKELRKELASLQNKKLEYIVFEKKKPKPLRLYEPRIETVYDSKKHKQVSKEKAEKEKLLHKYKKEMKGAMREIRRDTAFLAKVQIKQQIASDAERKRKVKEIFGEAAMQQSELNKMKRKK